MMDVIFIFSTLNCFLLLKSTWRYPQFTHVYQKLGSDDVWFLRCYVSVMDRLIDGWMEKWHIEVDALHCFSLKIYVFCSNNALYSESLQSISTRMFETFDSWDHYYFESNLSLELLIKVFFIKKHVTFFLSLLKKKKELCHMKLFLCSSGISLGRYCKKILTKSRGFRKKIKRRDGHIVGSGSGVEDVYRRGIKPSPHYELKWFKTKLCDKSWI